jgi:hypothetical protein
VGIGWESAGPNMTAMLQSRDEERHYRERRTDWWTVRMEDHSARRKNII